MGHLYLPKPPKPEPPGSSGGFQLGRHLQSVGSAMLGRAKSSSLSGSVFFARSLAAVCRSERLDVVRSKDMGNKQLLNVAPQSHRSFRTPKPPASHRSPPRPRGSAAQLLPEPGGRAGGGIGPGDDCRKRKMAKMVGYHPTGRYDSFSRKVW